MGKRHVPPPLILPFPPRKEPQLGKGTQFKLSWQNSFGLRVLSIPVVRHFLQGMNSFAAVESGQKSFGPPLGCCLLVRLPLL